MATLSFKYLVVWQKSLDLTTSIYQTFSSSRDYAFRDQIQRASVSIMNNIAESYARRSDKAFKNFLYIARGSTAEVENMIILALRLGYIDIGNQKKLLEQIDEVAKLISAFIKKL